MVLFRFLFIKHTLHFRTILQCISQRYLYAILLLGVSPVDLTLEITKAFPTWHLQQDIRYRYRKSPIRILIKNYKTALLVNICFTSYFEHILVQGMWNVLCIGILMEEAFISFTSDKETTTLGLL